MSAASRFTTYDRGFHALCACCVALPLVFAGWFVVDAVASALPGLSSHAVRLGILASLLQSARIVGFALALALPIGVAAAVHLEYYAARGMTKSLAERAMTLLAAVPSVLYGLFGVVVSSALVGIRSMLSASTITLAIFLFPIVVVRTRAALRTVPPLVREAALALGADPWRALVHVVVPLAMPTLVVEVLLVLARALGTAAPLLVVGAFFPVQKVVVIQPLAVGIFDSASAPDPAQRPIAAAAVIVLLVLFVVLHALANALSARAATRQHHAAQESLSSRGTA